jgi:hypothetical protein
VAHDALRDLRGDTLACQQCAERGPHGVQVDNATLCILAHDPGLRSLIFAFADHDRLILMMTRTSTWSSATRSMARLR